MLIKLLNVFVGRLETIRNLFLPDLGRRKKSSRFSSSQFFIVNSSRGLLATTSFMQETRIDGRKSDLFNQARDDLFRLRVVSGDENRASPLERRTRVASSRQMFARSSLVIVEFSKFSIALRIVVPGVDYDLALKSICRERSEFAERNGNQHHIAEPRRVLNRRCSRVST